MSCAEYSLLLLAPDVRPLFVMHVPEGYFRLFSVSAACTLWRHRCAGSVVIRCSPGGVHTEQVVSDEGLSVFAVGTDVRKCSSV